MVMRAFNVVRIHTKGSAVKISKLGVVLALMVVMGGVLVVGKPAAVADARSDLDSLKRDWDSRKSELQSRKSELDKYLENSRALRGFDKEELDKLIKAMCGQDVERDGDEADRVNSDLRERAVDAVRRKWDDITREWDNTEDKLERLMNDVKSLRDRVKSIPEEDAVKSDRATLLDQVLRAVDEIDRMYAKLQDDYRSLSNVKEGVMYGSNNPKIRAAMEHGKRKHVEMQSSCHEKETVLSSGRPDCIYFTKDDCKVVEFKPTTVGDSAARSQAERYLGDVQRYFKDDRRAVENCRKDSSGLPIFSAEGKTYNACTP
jgi:hypothetical protein